MTTIIPAIRTPREPRDWPLWLWLLLFGIAQRRCDRENARRQAEYESELELYRTFMASKRSKP